MSERTPRDLSTRETKTRKKTWAPPSLLPDPPKSDDWRYKWVRVSARGEADPTNASRKLREGWEWVPSDDPIADHVRLQADRTENKSIIEIGGLALARMPEELAKQREDYFSNMAEQQVESMDRNYLRENDPRMPLLKPERVSKST